MGRTSATIKKACAGNVLTSYVLDQTGAGWTTLTARAANTRRRQRATAYLDERACEAMGVFDVQDYYPGIDIDVMADQLVGRGAPTGAVTACITALRCIAESGGPTGLPVGFEGSGLFGNMYLLPADVTFQARRLALLRYTDDSWLFLRDIADWNDALDEYRCRVAQLRLTLNDRKTDVFDNF